MRRRIDLRHRPGIEPTIHAAERVLRPAAICRTQCCGTQSADGRRFVERILFGVMVYCPQGRNVWNLLTDVVEDVIADQLAPILLPAS